MKLNTFALVVCAALSLVGFACATPPPAATPGGAIPSKLTGPVTLEYWYPYGGTVGSAVEAAVKRFNQSQNGQITVNATFQGTFDQQLAKIRAAAAGGGLPQVTTVRESDVVQFQASSLVVPLDAYFKDSSAGLTQQQLDDFYPGVLGRTKLTVYANQTLAWPFGNTAAAWFYNLDLMRRAGVAQPPATWDDVLAQAQPIKASTGQPLWDLRADQAGPIFIDVLWTYGVPWLSNDGKSSNFDNPAALKALRMFRQMVDEGTLVVSSTAEQDFPNGRGAMLWASSGNLVSFSTQITAFEWGVALVPHDSASKPVTEMFGSVNTMFKGSPDQQLAAWTFLKFMASPEAQAQFASDTGYFPSARSSGESAVVQSAYQRVPQFRTAVETISPAMQLLPQSPALDQVRNRIATDDVSQVLLQKMTPEDGIKKLKFDADQALKQASQ